nr:36.4 kDa proline-rich protein-like [Penaeus vannamei]
MNPPGYLPHGPPTYCLMDPNIMPLSYGPQHIMPHGPQHNALKHQTYCLMDPHIMRPPWSIPSWTPNILPHGSPLMDPQHMPHGGHMASCPPSWTHGLSLMDPQHIATWSLLMDPNICLMVSPHGLMVLSPMTPNILPHGPPLMDGPPTYCLMVSHCHGLPLMDPQHIATWSLPHGPPTYCLMVSPSWTMASWSSLMDPKWPHGLSLMDPHIAMVSPSMDPPRYCLMVSPSWTPQPHGPHMAS